MTTGSLLGLRDLSQMSSISAGSPNSFHVLTLAQHGPARANIFFGRGFDLEKFLFNNFLFDNLKTNAMKVCCLLHMM